ncbi:UNVERIFIED_CONTAM: hypothetical protein FKN15_008812 [Acipenser sinensis]
MVADVSHCCDAIGNMRNQTLNFSPCNTLPHLAAIRNTREYMPDVFRVEFLDHSEVSLTEAIPEGRKTNGQRNEAKDLAVIRLRQTEQERQMSKGPKQPHTPEVSKRTRLKPSLCQKQLDQVLEKISMMHIHDEKGPLEFLYTMHMPNCDKQGLYNLKQCKMSVNGRRGECWCVSPSTGKPIPNSPMMRGDPECNLYYKENEGSLPHK